jgi:hypothetical protein
MCLLPDYLRDRLVSQSGNGITCKFRRKQLDCQSLLYFPLQNLSVCGVLIIPLYQGVIIPVLIALYRSRQLVGK